MIHAVIIDKESNRTFWEAFSDNDIKISLCSCLTDLPCCDAVLIADELTGIDLSGSIKKVRAMEGFKSVPVAAVTEKHSTEKQTELLECGYDDVIHIPLCKELLLKRIEALASSLTYSLSYDGFSFETLMDIRDDGELGAYSVHSGDFTSIYRFVLRILKRFRQKAQILMLSLSGGEDDDAEHRKLVMQAFSNAVRICLRRGDMASVCSENRIVVLLLGADDDGGHLVANRIVSNFYSECSDDSYKISYDLRDVRA